MKSTTFLLMVAAVLQFGCSGQGDAPVPPQSAEVTRSHIEQSPHMPEAVRKAAMEANDRMGGAKPKR